MKYIGLLLIFSCMSYGGYLLSGGYRKEWIQLEGYHQFCLQLKSEMETGRTELFVALERSAAKYLPDPLRTYIEGIASQLKTYQEKDLGSLWKEAMQRLETEPGNYLGEEEMNFLYQLGTILSGNQSYFGHWEQLALHIEQVALYHEQLSETIPKKQKLSLQMGVCLGGLLVIMLF